MTRAAVGFASLIAVFATGACATTANPQESQRAAMLATGTPSPDVKPIGDPRNSRVVTGKGFRLSVDSAFQQIDDLKSSNGQPMLVLRRASGTPALPIQVAVLREPDPEQDVVEQSYALEVSKRTASGATDVIRSTVTWPGTTQAELVQWTENVAASTSASVPTRYWQLNAQVNRHLILVVVGFAPADEFEGSGIDDAIATFRVVG